MANHLLQAPPIQFNISHAGNYLACVIANEPVGVDIEIIKTANMQIAKRFFTPDETAYTMHGHKNIRFYEVWTKKRAESNGKERACINLYPFSVFESNTQKQLIYHNVFQNNEAICHVCSTKQKPPLVRMIDTTRFINNII